MPGAFELNRNGRFLTGLLGAPIQHSASPAIHEAAAADLGLTCFYQLIEIAEADAARLRSLLAAVRELGFAGINITFPYKEAVLSHLDVLADSARSVGAVNTIVIEGERLVGHNTDYTGFSRASANLIHWSKSAPIALVGAGGVGKAIAAALAGHGVAELRIYDRDPRKAESLVRSVAAKRTRMIVVDSLPDALNDVAGIINGTPVGMWPGNESPVPDKYLHGGLWVADAVYSPLWTPLLIAAKKAGAKVVTGRDLVLYQALDAFRLFTGLEPSIAVMSAAFDRVMASRQETLRAG